MLSVAIFGNNRVDGSMVEPGERVIALSMFGGINIDFVSTPPPPLTEVLIVAVFGGVSLKVRLEQDVKLSGFSIFGGRSVKPRRQLPPPADGTPPAPADDTSELPLDVDAYAIFGGISVERNGQTDEGNRIKLKG